MESDLRVFVCYFNPKNSNNLRTRIAEDTPII